MYFCTRRCFGIFFRGPAEPLLQSRPNSGAVCRTYVACCCRRSKDHRIQSSITAHSFAKRRYHKQLLQHLNNSKDEEAILHYFKKNIVYNQDGIVAINKPPGLGVSGRVNEDDDTSPLTLASMMSQVADLTDCPSAEIAQGLDKEASGLVLLAENKVDAKKIQSKIKEARDRRQFIKTYRTIVCGIPEMRTGVLKMYLGSDVIGGIKMTVGRHNPSGRQIRDGDVWSAETKYRVISENKELGCAFMELQPLRVKRHQLQVQMVNELCPILGDHTYSHQAKTILGKPILMDPHQALGNHNIQVLSPGIRKALAMTRPQVSLLPLFLHLHQVVLPEWAGHQDVTIIAPLPSHFTRALQELGLGSGDSSEDIKQLTSSAS